MGIEPTSIDNRGRLPDAQGCASAAEDRMSGSGHHPLHLTVALDPDLIEIEPTSTANQVRLTDAQGYASAAQERQGQDVGERPSPATRSTNVDCTSCLSGGSGLQYGFWDPCPATVRA